MSACICDGVLSFEPTVRKQKSIRKPYLYPLADGFFRIPDTPFAVQLADDTDFLKNNAGIPEDYALYDSAILAKDRCGAFCVRSRGDGDTVRCGGMTRKLKELLNQKKIPTELRGLLPLVCAADTQELLFVPRVAVCDAHAHSLGASRKLCRVSIYIRNGA